MSAQDLADLPQELPLDGSAHRYSDDGLLDALAQERAARERAEELYRERDAAVAKLQVEMRDLGRLRDNFHSLYREERELRAEADRVAAERSEEHDALQQEISLLRGDVDRLNRTVERLKAKGAAPAPAAAAPPVAPSAPTLPADPRVQELERDAGVLRAHASELEAAVAERATELGEATQRIATLEREVAMARAQLAGRETGAPDGGAARIAELEAEIATLRAAHTALQSGREEHAGELAAAVRRIHDLDGELATLRVEHADVRAAHDRVRASRDALQQSLAAEQAQREEGQRFVASAEQRVRDAVTREQEAVRVAHEQAAAAEGAEQQVQAARATIAVLEQRIHDAETGREAAEQRAAALDEELEFVRSNVLAGRSQAPAKRTLLRRKPGNGHPAGPHVETVGTPVGADATMEVTGAPEDVETALHRRLFGGE